MTIDALTAVDNDMTAMGLEYQFGRYTKSPPRYPYLVGTYLETPPTSENGLREGTLVLDAYTRDSAYHLEQVKSRIEQYYDRNTGHTVQLPDGSILMIYYLNAQHVPTLDADMKHMTINLQVQEWSVK